MAPWIDGIEHPIKTQFEEHDRIIRKYTVLVPDPDFQSADSFDVLQDVLRSANTVRNYYKRLEMGGGAKRRRDTPNVSDSKDTPRPSKVPQMAASKKQSRDEIDSGDSSEDESTSRSSKMPRVTANKKRSRDDVDSRGDEGASKPTKKPCLGTEKVEMTKAVKDLQALLNSVKGSK